ncbi:MAG: hypothetical protein L6Q99_08505 [Planctomycetes bacterium]|nr:hypothetical protein [Planctomycetota bacterium]
MKYALGVLALLVLLGFVWFSREPAYRPLTVALQADAATPDSRREGPFEWWSTSAKHEPVFLEVGKFEVTPRRVHPSTDSAGRSALGIELPKSDGSRLGDFTARHVGRTLVILFEGRVVMLGALEEPLNRNFAVASALMPAEIAELRRRLTE